VPDTNEDACRLLVVNLYDVTAVAVLVSVEVVVDRMEEVETDLVADIGTDGSFVP